MQCPCGGQTFNTSRCKSRSAVRVDGSVRYRDCCSACGRERIEPEGLPLTDNTCEACFGFIHTAEGTEYAVHRRTADLDLHIYRPRDGWLFAGTKDSWLLDLYVFLGGEFS